MKNKIRISEDKRKNKMVLGVEWIGGKKIVAALEPDGKYESFHRENYLDMKRCLRPHRTVMSSEDSNPGS